MRFSLHIHALFCTLCLLIAEGCSDIVLPKGDPQLVIEGWIEDGGHPVVIVTTTVPVERELQSIENLKDHVVRWAKVSISDGEKETVLYGGSNKSYFPPYIYTTADMKGESGKTYTLTVSYNGKTAMAKTTIPQSVPLEFIRIHEVADENDRFYLSAGICDNPYTKDHYKFFTKVMNSDSTFISSFLGLNDDSTMGSGITEVPIHNGTGTLTSTLNPYFSAEDRIIVKFCNMDEISYRYWSDFDEVASLSRNPIFPVTTVISTNIAGGLGYWAGYGLTRYRVSIPDSLALGKIH